MEWIGVVYFYIHSTFSFRVYRILTLLIPFAVSWKRWSRWMGEGIAKAVPHSVYVIP